MKRFNPGRPGRLPSHGANEVPGPSLLWALALLLAATVGMGMSVSAAGTDAPTAAGITIRGTVTVENAASGSISLLQLMDPATADSPALALVWQADSSGWFPTWELQLQSHTGLLSDTKQKQTIALGKAQPLPGRLYEVGLSYEFHTGVVAAFVYDTHDQKYVLQHDRRINPARGPLHPAPSHAGTVTHAYQPVGARWSTMAGPEHDRGLSRLIETYDEPTWVRIVTTEPAAGQFQLSVSDDTTDTVIPLGAAAQGETVYPLDMRNLAPGTYDARLQYTVNDTVIWESRSNVLQLGKITAMPYEPRLQNEGNELGVTLSVTATLPLAAVDMELTAAVYDMAWDARRGAYNESLAAEHTVALPRIDRLSAEPQTVEVTVPLPAVPGLWRVRLDLKPDPAIATIVTDRDIRLSTETNTILGVKGADDAIRICSYNMLGFEGYPMQPTVSYLGDMNDLRRVNHFAHVIRTMNCDIIGVQEGHSVEMMKRIAQALGNNLVAMPSASRFPGGIFTHYPVMETRLFNHAGPANQSEPFSRFGGATLLDVDGHPTWVINFHAWPHEEAMREQEATILKDHLSRLMGPGARVIVMGDFNSQVGGVFDRMLVELGLTNVMGLDWIGIQPTIPGSSAAIDHIYVSNNLVPAITSGRIHQGLGFDTSNPLGSGEWLNSDHFPVVVELIWP